MYLNATVIKCMAMILDLKHYPLQTHLSKSFQEGSSAQSVPIFTLEVTEDS